MTKGLEMGWMTNEFYLEYLELKLDIRELVERREFAHIFLDKGKSNQEKLDKKLERMKVVLWELNNGGVTAETLLYLSWGIELEAKPEKRSGGVTPC